MTRALILAAALIPMMMVSAHARPRAFDRVDRVIRHHDDARPMRVERQIRTFERYNRTQRVRTPRMPARLQALHNRGDIAVKNHTSRTERQAERMAARARNTRAARAPGRLGALLEKRKDMAVGGRDVVAKQRGEAKKSRLEERNKYMRKGLLGQPIALPAVMPGKLKIAIEKHKHIQNHEPF